MLTAEQWREAADYLNACMTCGREHPWRVLSNHMGTYADELDGHALRRRGSNESRLALLEKAGRVELGDDS